MNDKAASPPRRWLKPSAALNRFKPPPLSTQTTAAPAERQNVRYGFRVGGICLLIRENTTSEVIEQPPVYRLPNTPAWLLGLVNLRGNLVPVFDIKKLFDLESDTREKNRLLVLDQADKAVGMMIDSLPQPASLNQPLSLLPPLPPELQPHVDKAYAQEGLIWLEFDHHAFFQSLSEKISTA